MSRPVPDHLAASVKRHAERLGLRPLARRLDVSETTAARLAAGLPVQAGTLALVGPKVAELDAGASS